MRMHNSWSRLAQNFKAQMGHSKVFSFSFWFCSATQSQCDGRLASLDKALPLERIAMAWCPVGWLDGRHRQYSHGYDRQKRGEIASINSSGPIVMHIWTGPLSPWQRQSCRMVSSNVNPKMMAIGPVPAIQHKRCRKKLVSSWLIWMDRIEIND